MSYSLYPPISFLSSSHSLATINPNYAHLFFIYVITEVWRNYAYLFIVPENYCTTINFF